MLFCAKDGVTVAPNNDATATMLKNEKFKLLHVS
jgi:hypothetical protein